MPYRDAPPVPVKPTIRAPSKVDLVIELLAWVVARNGPPPTLIRCRAQRLAREWMEDVERFERSRRARVSRSAGDRSQV